MSEEIMLSHRGVIKPILDVEMRKKMQELGVQRGVLDESSFEEFPPFFFRAEISNDLLDSHFTHMDEATSLVNYVEDASRGVAFLKGHNWTEIPIGYSIQGQLEDYEGRKRVVADFYTVSGLSETNDLIARLRTGLARDVSIGFSGGEHICDLCGQDFWSCRHYPGLKYEERDGDEVKMQLATFTVLDARLSEVSSVFDGSTPNAMVLKAERAAAQGDLSRQQVQLLEQRYRIHLPSRTNFPVDSPKPKDNNQEVRTVDEKQLKRLGEVLVKSGVVPQEKRGEALDAEVTIGFVEELAGRVAGLEGEAKDGRQYRSDLVEEALGQGVRAMGNEFDRESYESSLRSSPLTIVKRMRDDWKAIADKTIPTGRHTETGDGEGDNSEQRSVPVHLIPDEAYI